MKKQGKGEGSGHGSSERWLLTYADMITLLMAFFIMMYSMSVMNIAKFHEAAVSIRSGFGGAMAGQGKSVLSSNGQVSFKPSPISGDTTGVAWQAINRLRDIAKNDPVIRHAIRIFADKRGSC